jgi:hypothetical protein
MKSYNDSFFNSVAAAYRQKVNGKNNKKQLKFNLNTQCDAKITTSAVTHLAVPCAHAAPRWRWQWPLPAAAGDLPRGRPAGAPVRPSPVWAY